MASDVLTTPKSGELLRFATAGSVDDGKSTLIGRLLYDTKAIFEDQLEQVAEASKRRHPRPRALHAQHGHGRFDRRPRARSCRRAQRRRPAVAPPRVHLVAAAH